MNKKQNIRLAALGAAVLLGMTSAGAVRAAEQPAVQSYGEVIPWHTTESFSEEPGGRIADTAEPGDPVSKEPAGSMESSILAEEAAYPAGEGIPQEKQDPEPAAEDTRPGTANTGSAESGTERAAENPPADIPAENSDEENEPAGMDFMPAAFENEMPARIKTADLSESPEVWKRAQETAGIETIHPEQISDSTYAFSLKANEETRLEPFGISGRFYQNRDLLQFIPTDISQSGQAGAWIYHAGSYQGQDIDVKCTCIFREEKRGEKGETFLPFIGIHLLREQGLIEFQFMEQDYEIRYDLYTRKNGIEVPVRLSLSADLGDIDSSQIFGFKVNEGRIMRRQVSENSTVCYAGDKNAGGYEFVFDREGREKEVSDPSGEFRIEMADTKSFSVWFCGQGECCPFPFSGKSTGMEGVRRAASRLEKGQRCFYSKAEGILIGVGYFNGLGFAPYELPAPLKRIGGKTAEEQEENMVSPGESFQYHVIQKVPLERQEFRYDRFILEDLIPEGLEVRRIRVKNDAGRNVAELFHIETIGQKVKIRCREPKKAAFYGNEYDVEIDVVCRKEGIRPEKKMINRAEVSITRGGGEERKKSNEVVTVLRTAEIRTEVVNGKITEKEEGIPHGETRTVSYTPEEGYVLTEVIVDGEAVDIRKYKEQYTFRDLRENHNIRAVYGKRPGKTVENERKVQKDGGYVFRGEKMCFRITVENPSETEKLYRIEDRIPEGAEFIYADHGGKRQEKKVVWECRIPAGKEKTVSFFVRAEKAGGRIRNKAKVFWQNGEAETNETVTAVSGEPEKIPFDLQGNKISESFILPGEEFLYTIMMPNPSEQQEEYCVSDQISDHLEIREISRGGVREEGNRVSWRGKTVPGKPLAFSVRVRAKESISGKRIENTAQIRFGDNELKAGPAVVHGGYPPVENHKRKSEGKERQSDDASKEQKTDGTAVRTGDLGAEKVYFLLFVLSFTGLLVFFRRTWYS